MRQSCPPLALPILFHLGSRDGTIPDHSLDVPDHSLDASVRTNTVEPPRTSTESPSMILVALGTDGHPFERALDLVDALSPPHELVVQHGHTPARKWPEAQWFPFVPFETIVSLTGEAEAVICHAGVGTIMTVLSLGRRPVVIARRAARGEHVDDHQLQIVEKLRLRGLVIPVDAGDDIAGAVREAQNGTVEWKRDPRLRKAVAAAAAAGARSA
jgi:UDP-N-acetylglucosamine transferase subunit ALG13